MLSIDERAHAPTASRSTPRSSAATSTLRCAPSRTISRAADDHARVTSAAPAAKTAASQRVLGLERRRAGRRRASTVTRSASAPGCDRAGLGPAERARARRRSPRRAARGARGAPRSPVASRSSSSTARASSNRSIDRVRVASRARAPRRRRRARRAGPMPSARSRSVVGQRQHVRAGAAEQRDVASVEVGGVDRGEVRGRARRPRASSPVGVRP